jgi:hypothetical protein
VQQEFKHIAAPEQNEHIEAYQGILKRRFFLDLSTPHLGEFNK